VLAKRGAEVGARQRALTSNLPWLFECSGQRPRNEFHGTTSALRFARQSR